ncbi:cell wall-binding repeat-containing protein [Schumannella luteola]
MLRITVAAAVIVGSLGAVSPAVADEPAPEPTPTLGSESAPPAEDAAPTQTTDPAPTDITPTAGQAAPATGPVIAGAVTPFAPGTIRLAGSDRYATAVKISQRYVAGVSKVYIATGTNYPDALSAASVAAAEGVPLLLVLPTSIPAVVWTELTRLSPDQIVVAGGPTTVADSVVAQLSSIAPVTRFGGVDRFETSRMLAAQASLSGTTTYIATGLNFPDALSSAAAAGSQGGAVVLVNGSAAGVDSSTLSTLSALGTDNIRIAGSSASVSIGVASSLESHYPVERYSGMDRFETGALLNADAFTAPSTVFLALGTNFPDALAGGALAGTLDAPLFISRAECIPAPVADLISAWSPSTVVVLGSTASLSTNVENLVACPSNPGDVVDCSSFSSWSEAQSWYSTYYPYYGDVAHLDADGDGLACETLPGGPEAPPTPPTNPGNSVNCSDFSTWAAAQAWFDTYFPYYGDVAQLDADHDGIACESLPGHP